MRSPLVVFCALLILYLSGCAHGPASKAARTKSHLPEGTMQQDKQDTNPLLPDTIHMLQGSKSPDQPKQGNGTKTGRSLDGIVPPPPVKPPAIGGSGG